MKSTIIITGGCGYIGSHTAIELINADYEVVIFDNLSNSSIETLDRIKSLTGTKPKFVNVDLSIINAAKEAFLKYDFADGVIHFAALKAVGESVQKPLEYYRNNLFSLINTIESQVSNNIHSIIFSSSATVYGTPDAFPITEESPTQRPYSPYGNSKKLAEEIIEDIAKANEKFKAISLRYFNPIGAHESGLIGELPTGTPNNLLPFITQTAIGIRDKLLVFGNDYPTPDGTPIRDYIHVVDLAKAHVLAVDRLVSNANENNFEVYNLGTGKGYSVFDIINAFKKVTGQKLNYEIIARRTGDVPQLYSSAKLANEKLGWDARLSLDEMIASAWKWERNYRNK